MNYEVKILDNLYQEIHLIPTKDGETLKLKIKDFNGIIPGIDRVDMDETHTPDTINTNISTNGQLTACLGFQKVSTVTSALAGEIDAIWQVNENEIVVCNGAVQKV